MTRTPAASLAWAALAGAALQGCTPSLPPPELSSATPDWAYNGEATEVRITGEGFYPAVSVDLSRQEPSVDRQFIVELLGERTVALEGVQLRSTTELTGFVPPGELPGTYDLRVTTPEGQQATLERAFAVTETRADHLSLVLDPGPYQVGEPVVLGVQLQDPNDSLVPLSMPVEVHFSSSSGETGLEIRNTDLEGFVLLQDGLRGHLPPSGEAFVAFSSTRSELLTVVASPADSESFVDSSEPGFVSFEAGDVAGIELQIPEGLEAVAGTPFDVIFTPLDELGNALHGERVLLHLEDESCFGAVRPATVELTGPEEVEVTFYRSCDSTRLLVSGDAQGATGSFPVAAGPVQELALRLDPADPQDTVTAGEPELDLVVEAVDAYNNRVHTYQGELEWVDDVGGLDTLLGVGDASCGAWAVGTRSCTLTLEVAAEEVSVSAFDQRGNSGTLLQPVTVLPAEPALLTVDLTETEHVAGLGFQLEVDVIDAWGNVAALDPAGADPFEVEDGFGTTSCEWLGQDGFGVHLLECVSTTAAQVSYQVSLPSRGVQGESAGVEVVNGAAAQASISVPGSVTAGQGFSVSVETWDAWGNPYQTGSRSVQLTDDTGAVARTLTLDGDGRWSGSGFSITTSGERTLTLSQNNLTLEEQLLTVDPGALAQLLVQAERSWAWVGEARVITVSGVDTYGNVVPSYAGPVTLSSESALFVSRTLSTFSSGVASVGLAWDDPGLGDRVRAEGPGGESGLSQRIDAVQSCSGGPTASLSLDDDGVACLVGGTASVGADLSGSVAGDSALTAYHLADGQGGSARSLTDSFTLTAQGAGAYRVEAVVVDADACAEEVVDTLWADVAGKPAGPLVVAVAQPARTAGGTSTTADTTVTVTATDCAGDVPTSNVVYVRTNLGSLTGVTKASDGLTAGLSSGVASLTWSGQSLAFDGTATVAAGTLTGGAFGSAEVAVTGDSTRPQVAWVDPSGTTDELFGEVTVGFTDDLLPQNSASLFALQGPDGDVDFSLSISGDEALLTLDEQQDASTGEWVLSIDAGLRDDSGNRLDGEWSGNVSDFRWSFGDVLDEGLIVSACAPDSDTLTPDGADGSGDETDDVALSVSASATPEWWRLVVYDLEGQPWRHQTVVAASSSETLSWDARSDQGMVLGAGVYTLSVSAIDLQGNVSDPCEQAVQIRERYGNVE